MDKLTLLRGVKIPRSETPISDYETFNSSQSSQKAQNDSIRSNSSMLDSPKAVNGKGDGQGQKRPNDVERSSLEDSSKKKKLMILRITALMII